jgi:single-stranded-DNA-specific exonuclease
MDKQEEVFVHLEVKMYWILLKGCEDILNQFGGHPEAGGFAIEIDRIPKLQKRIYELSENWLKDQTFNAKQIQSDLLVTS